MSAHTPRTFEVPAALVAAGFAPTTDLDALDREVEFDGDFGDWAEKVLLRENAKTLEEVCGDMRLLPRGILSSVQLDDDSLLIDGLVDSDGRVWDHQFNAWGIPSEPIDIAERSIMLEDDEVAFVARALREGADEVWFRPFVPKAFVSALVAAPPPPQDRLGKKAKQPEEAPVGQEVPAGSAIIAVVDPIDEDAVLEMLAIAPGPKALRRHDGQWIDDPAWIPVLKSVRPPKIVKLNETQVASVTSQVDKATVDQDWEPFDSDTREQYQIFTASAYLQELQNESDERALKSLIAVAGKELSPKDVASTERLKRYWTVGKGAAKIRWGTPGSWRRCYRHLVKYVGPKMAPGLCTNLGQRLGGHGVATHVTSAGAPAEPRYAIVPDSATGDESWRNCPEHGDICEDGAYAAVCEVCDWTNYYSEEALVAANPSGENGYDNGQTFNESGAKRDYHGRFSSGGGHDRGARTKRREASMARSRKAREEKEAKSSNSEARKAEAATKKAEAAAKRAKNQAQAEELAQISLQISEAVAAGNTVGAAELHVKRAEKRLQFADTEVERLNAQTALNNARAALNRARSGANTRRRSTRTDPFVEAEAQRRHDQLMTEFETEFENQ